MTDQGIPLLARKRHIKKPERNRALAECDWISFMRFLCLLEA
jgi:hypothetical protein